MVKKVLLIVFGLLGMLVGTGLAIGGGVLFAITGGDGWITSGAGTLSTDTFGFVSASQVIKNGTFTGPHGNDVQLRVQAQVTGAKQVFIGLGPTADVDRYLAGVPHELVTRVHFSPFRLDTVRQDGSTSPQPPSDQTFWTAKVSGTGLQRLDWSLPASGDYRVVLMNADGSPTVTVDSAGVGVRVPFLHSLGLGLLVGGIVLGAVGLLLFIWGLVTKAPPRAAPPGAYPPGWPPPPGYGPPGYGPPGGPPPAWGPGSAYGQSGYPGYPAPPGQPGYAEQPTYPGQPGQPGQAGQPGQPAPWGQPEQAGAPGPGEPPSWAASPGPAWPGPAGPAAGPERGQAAGPDQPAGPPGEGGEAAPAESGPAESGPAESGPAESGPDEPRPPRTGDDRGEGSPAE